MNLLPVVRPASHIDQRTPCAAVLHTFAPVAIMASGQVVKAAVPSLVLTIAGTVIVLNSCFLQREQRFIIGRFAMTFLAMACGPPVLEVIAPKKSIVVSTEIVGI